MGFNAIAAFLYSTVSISLQMAVLLNNRSLSSKLYSKTVTPINPICTILEILVLQLRSWSGPRVNPVLKKGYFLELQNRAK